MLRPTRRQLDIMRHALGLPHSAEGYRNYFVTGPGSSDYSHIQELCQEGYMRRVENAQLPEGDECYMVTNEGKDLCKRKVH